MALLKERLYNHCLEHIEKSIKAAQNAIESARDAARNETKSSAGDKYETAREMMQQDIDLNNLRIAELQKMKAALEMANLEAHSVIKHGSLVTTNHGNFFLGASIGKIEVEANFYFTLTQSSPLGARLIGKKAGDKLSLNGKEFVIKEIL